MTGGTDSKVRVKHLLMELQGKTKVLKMILRVKNYGVKTTHAVRQQILH